MSEITNLSDHNDLEALSILENYRDWIVSSFSPHLAGTAVEYGAGIGNISTHLLPHVRTLDLIEPYAPLAAKLSEKFSGDSRVRIVPISIEESVAVTASEVYDSVIMVNVLEHIADDGEIMAELHRVLRFKGVLCLFVPAHAALYSAYDRLVGHHRRYALYGLRKLVQDAGFEIIESRYFDILGVAPWWVTMKALGTTRIKPGLGLIYDRLAVPLGRRLEAIVNPPFGKNVILVARKIR
jgi:SAM-dependent methyltransferase